MPRNREKVYWDQNTANSCTINTKVLKTQMTQVIRICETINCWRASRNASKCKIVLEIIWAKTVQLNVNSIKPTINSPQKNLNTAVESFNLHQYMPENINGMIKPYLAKCLS